MEFVGKIGIDRAKAGSGFDDKNKLSLVITPDRSEYGCHHEGRGDQRDAGALPADSRPGVWRPDQRFPCRRCRRRPSGLGPERPDAANTSGPG